MDKSSNEIEGTERHHMSKLPQSFWNFSHKDAAEIQREIKVTRADLDETVNALQERLAPQQYLSHALEMARDTLREASPKIAQAVRENPLPAALIALGVGWLYLRATAPPKPRYPVYASTDESEFALTHGGVGEKVGEGWDKAKGSIQSSAAEVKDWTSQKAGQIMDSTAKYAGQALDKAGELTGQAMEKAGEWAGSAREKAGEVVHQARIQAEHFGEYTRDQLGRVGDGAVQMYKENPWAFAAIGLGLGAALAMSLPITQQEQQVMGKASDQVVNSARDAGEQTMAKVSQVVQSGQEAMKDEARREDLI